MERFPWHPRLRPARIARTVAVTAATALTLAVVAAVTLAATSATPNGCPTNKSAKTAPIAELSPPARLQIVAFDVLSGPINEQSDTFTLKVRIGSTCGVNVKGASVYVTAVPYNQFDIPDERLSVTTAPQHSASGGCRTSPQAANSSNSRSSSARPSRARTFSPASRPGASSRSTSPVRTRCERSAAALLRASPPAEPRAEEVSDTSGVGSRVVCPRGQGLWKRPGRAGSRS